ncbi:MAG: DUF6850 family outer membrane beta-barrel protein [Bacteroidota bacterium]
MRKSFAALFIILFLSINADAQVSRTGAMGGLSYSVLDRDQSLSPYDFGKNPAWLYMDEKDSYLRIEPGVQNVWGDYRRKFDSKSVTNVNISFTGIKTLGTLGTFYGTTVYDYELRTDYYRTVRKDPYAGEAFNVADTMEGNFRYNGPYINLMYSWELLPELYIGGGIFYQIQDGLKSTYSYAKTIYRNTGGKLGIAYRLLDNLVLGTSINYFSKQEAIEESDINLLDIEAIIYRGDTYHVIDRANTNEQKIKGKGTTLSGQVYWEVDENLKIGIQGNYEPSNSKLTFPELSLIDVEDGYTSFEYYDTQVKSQYNLDDNLLIGVYGGYFHNYSWSKLSKKDLLIWEWEINRLVAGVGSSYKVEPNLLVGAEYEFSSADVDSSKYIDSKMNSFSSVDHIIRIGAEYELSNSVFIRTGYNYCFDEHDLILGGNDVARHSFTFGGGFLLSDLFIVDAYLEYSNRSPNKMDNYNRSSVGGRITITLNNF